LTKVIKSANMLSMLNSDQEFHIGGYHGTDRYSAEQIIAAGFQETNGDVFLAPLDNLRFAQTHGERRARDRSKGEYAVVQAMFPGKKLEFGLGGDQIRIPASEVGRITVVGLMVFDVEQSRLILSRDRSQLDH